MDEQNFADQGDCGSPAVHLLSASCPAPIPLEHAFVMGTCTTAPLALPVIANGESHTIESDLSATEPL